MASDAVDNGAEEVDMVINLGWVKDRKWDDLLAEIKAVKAALQGKAAEGDHRVLLPHRRGEDQDVRDRYGLRRGLYQDLHRLRHRRRHPEDVALFAAHVGPNVKIKAAGGIADLKDAEDFIALGGHPGWGTSRIVKAVKAVEQK